MSFLRKISVSQHWKIYDGMENVQNAVVQNIGDMALEECESVLDVELLSVSLLEPYSTDFAFRFVLSF
jgi:hypothetical protein